MSVFLSQLLVSVAGGDKAAFRAVYDRAGSRVFAICLKLMRDRAEAEEVFQEAFTRIWERSWQFDPARGDALAWMATVARRCALDRLRAKKRDMLVFNPELANSEAGALDADFDGADLNRCLSSLREEYRKAIVLAYVEGLTHEEMAAVFQRPLGTVKSWVGRGLSQLKECLDQ